MDLFNKKKVAALQDELILVSANLEVTTKELDDLKKKVLKMYDELTDYFAPKYLKKYFKMNYDGNEIYFRCDGLKYEAGIILMDVLVSGDKEPSELTLLVSSLKQLKIATKQEYLKGGNK